MTIGAPVGLQFGQRSANLQSRGTLISETGTLGLSAQGISITGERNTFAAGLGSVAIASVGANARALMQRDRRGYQFSFDMTSTPFQDINIEGVKIASLGDRGGRIQMWGKQINISKAAQLIESTTGSGASDEISIEAERLVLSDQANIGTTSIAGTTSGNTTIKASSSVEVIGSSLFNELNAFILSQSGNVVISTPYLRMSNNAQIITSESRGQDSGNIHIKAEKAELFDAVTSISTTNLNNLLDRSEQESSSGKIMIETDSIFLKDGASISASSIGSADAGDITINASKWIELTGASEPVSPRAGISPKVFPSIISTLSVPGASGNSGDIFVNTPTLKIKQGARILGSTSSSGNGGNIIINAQELVEVDGFATTPDLDDFIDSSIGVNSRGEGNAGSVTINASNLRVVNGGSITANTSANGSGGDIRLNIQNLIQLRGDLSVLDENFRGYSSIQAVSEGTGNAGNISIDSNQIQIQDNAFIATLTAANGKGGDIRINASDQLVLIGGESDDNAPVDWSNAITSQTQGAGNAGDLIINTGSLLLSGEAFINTKTFGSGDAGNVSIFATDEIRLLGQILDLDGAQTQIEASAGTDAIVNNETLGSAGDIQLVTPNLFLIDGAKISAASFDSPTGNIRIDADLVRLDNQALITAETANPTQNGADIFLQARDALVMGGNSRITATAFDTANGGNIDISTGFLISLPPVVGTDGSDIVARASRGDGGRITIRSNDVLGFAERLAIPSNGTNDIDASSEFGNPGLVGITTPNLDPNPGEAELPLGSEPPEFLRACQSGKATNSSRFIISGRGGLPEEPGDLLIGDEPWIDGRSLMQNSEVPPVSVPVPATDLTEAQGWRVTPSGQIELLAAESTTKAMTCSHNTTNNLINERRTES